MIFSNYWTKLSVIPRIVKAEVCYLTKPQAEADNTNRGLDNFRYHAKTKFNNCSITHIKINTA